MKPLMLSEVLASLSKREIQYGLQTYAGGTMNVWIGENWARKAQTNLASDDMDRVAVWLQETAGVLFPQISATLAADVAEAVARADEMTD